MSNLAILPDERGQGCVEIGCIVIIVAVLIPVGIFFWPGPAIQKWLTEIGCSTRTPLSLAYVVSGELYLLISESVEPTRLAFVDGSRPDWSPDGERMLLSPKTVADDSEVCTIEVRTGREACLTDNNANDHSASWSPDGAQVVFVSDRDGSSEIYVMNKDGSEQRRVTNNNFADFDPDWSLDGTRIAFASKRGSPGYYSEICVIAVNGAEEKCLSGQLDPFAFELEASFSPQWSPDGAHILFVDRDDVVFYYQDRIYVTNSDLSALIPLTDEFEEDAFDPVWSPDGAQIAFTSNRDGDGYELYIANWDGTGYRRLTYNETGDVLSAWSLDGRYIAYVARRDGASAIHVYDLDSATDTCVAYSKEYIGWLRWQPQSPGD